MKNHDVLSVNDLFKQGIGMKYCYAIEKVQENVSIKIDAIEAIEIGPGLPKFKKQLDVHVNNINCFYRWFHIRNGISDYTLIEVYKLFGDIWQKEQENRTILSLRSEFKLKYLGEGKKLYIRRIAKYMKNKSL
jgi:putative ubiquitin-RnfH superfamily antitoxin RatB of RatAB toxin-antitoxin module